MSFSSDHTIGSDRCTDWQAWKRQGRESKLSLKICENATSTYGTYEFKNSNDTNVRIGFMLYFNNGKSYKGSMRINAYSQSNKAACPSCATNNSGLKEWSLTKIAFEGEDGYW